MEDFFHYNPTHDYEGDEMWKLMKMVTPEENPAVYMPAHYDPLHQFNQRISSSPSKQSALFDLEIIKMEEIQPNNQNDNSAKIEKVIKSHENQDEIKKEEPNSKCDELKLEMENEEANNSSRGIKDKHRRRNILISKKIISKIRVKTLKQLQNSMKGKCFQVFGSLYATTDDHICNYDIPIIDYLANKNFDLDCLAEIVELQDKQLKELQKRMIDSYGIDFIEETKEKKTYQCTQCDRIFSKASALGGHVSKMHSLHAQQVKKVNALKKKKKSN